MAKGQSDTGKTVLLDGREAIQLGDVLGNPGGEGSVYRVDSRPQIAIKIFPKTNIPSADKLMWLKQAGGGTLNGATIAWPTALVYKPVAGGVALCGYAMPRVESSFSFETLGNPQLREVQLRQAKATLDVRQLHQIGRNLVGAVEHAHHKGLVFADLNPKNVLANYRTCHVTLIDIDSALIATGPLRDVRARHTYEGYMAPELLTGSGLQPTTSMVRHRDRTIEADSWVLGIHLFSLLLGIFPYKFRTTTGLHPKTSGPDGLVIHGVFPYGQSVPAGYAPPEGEESRGKFVWLHPDLRRAFVNCFVAGHGDPSRRPKDSDWKQAFDRALADLVTCQHGHWHSSANGSCPRCRGKPGSAGAGKPHVVIQPSPKSSPSPPPKPPPPPPPPPPSSPPVFQTGAVSSAGVGARTIPVPPTSTPVPTPLGRAWWRPRIEGARARAVLLVMTLSLIGAYMLAPGPSLAVARAGISGVSWSVGQAVDSVGWTTARVAGLFGDDEPVRWLTSDSPNGGNSTSVLDGDPETFWTAETSTSYSGDTWVQIDLGVVTSIHSIRWLIPASGEGATIELSVSNDRRTWTHARTITLEEADVGVLRTRRVNASGRYIRMVIRDWPERGTEAEIAELMILTPSDMAGAEGTGSTQANGRPDGEPTGVAAPTSTRDSSAETPHARPRPTEQPPNAPRPADGRPDTAAPTIAPRPRPAPAPW